MHVGLSKDYLQADTGPLLGEKVFSDSLPVSAVNLGLGNNAFDKEQNPDLASTVAANVTLFDQQTFRASLHLHQEHSGYSHIPLLKITLMVQRA